jgi:hypothetical protein
MTLSHFMCEVGCRAAIGPGRLPIIGREPILYFQRLIDGTLLHYNDESFRYIEEVVREVEPRLSDGIGILLRPHFETMCTPWEYRLSQFSGCLTALGDQFEESMP